MGAAFSRDAPIAAKAAPTNPRLNGQVTRVMIKAGTEYRLLKETKACTDPPKPAHPEAESASVLFVGMALWHRGR